jgi:hypothetical protein
MNRRQQAIEILRKYQNALADKLTDLVIDQEEQLMEDATGVDLGFTNDLYDLAEKLRAVSVTLSVLPSEPESPPSKDSYQEGQSIVVVTALPQITISDFLALVQQNDLERAAQVLGHIFGIPLHMAAKCTDHFVHKAVTDDYTMNKVYQLGEALQSPRMSEAYDLMRELFGLLPNDAMAVVKHLKGA